jgi:hypothetical protein
LYTKYVTNGMRANSEFEVASQAPADGAQWWQCTAP